MAQLLCLESMDPDRDIQIYINSPGGSFTALTAIYDTMRFIKPDVQTVCLGQAASAAAILLAAGTPGKRLALPNSRILIHQPYTEGTYGQTSDIEIQANEILRMRELLETMIAEHSGKSPGGGQPRHRARQDPHRRAAVEYGLIDSILASRKAGASRSDPGAAGARDRSGTGQIVVSPTQSGGGRGTFESRWCRARSRGSSTAGVSLVTPEPRPSVRRRACGTHR